MLTPLRKPVSLCILSTDLPFCSVVETAATLYQKDYNRFHVLLQEPPVVDPFDENQTIPELSSSLTNTVVTQSRLLWLEISPYRVVMTMQGNGGYSYRHLWEKGMYGISRYWLQGESLQLPSQIRMRNFTRELTLVGRFLPDYLRLEYELWSERVQIGHYVLNLEIHH